MTANNWSHGSIIQLFCSREETLHHEYSSINQYKRVNTDSKRKISKKEKTEKQKKKIKIRKEKEEKEMKENDVSVTPIIHSN